MASLEEQETIITQSRADDYVSIYTSNSHDITFFKKDNRYTLVKEWFDPENGEVEAAEFRLHKDKANIRKITKSTRNLTEEQRKASIERLQRARALKDN